MTTAIAIGFARNSANVFCSGCRIDSGGLAPSVVGGLIGGTTVLIGVLCAEWLTRKRELAYKIDSAFADLLAQGALLLWDDSDDSTKNIHRKCALYFVELTKMQSAARPPLHGYKEIRTELEAILLRFNAASDRWQSGGKPPNVTELLGEQIGLLVHRKIHWWGT